MTGHGRVNVTETLYYVKLYWRGQAKVHARSLGLSPEFARGNPQAPGHTELSLLLHHAFAERQDAVDNVHFVAAIKAFKDGR